MTTVAFIVDRAFEDSELRVPFERLLEAHYQPVLIGRRARDRLVGKRGAVIVTDRAIADVDPSEFAGLVIPGGGSPERLRTNAAMVRLVRELFLQRKPVAAICHGGLMLVEARVVEGRTVTSWPSIRIELEKAGATWIDRDVVEDGNLVTSRKPADLEVFSAALVRQLEKGAAPRFRASAPARRSA